MDLWSYHFTLQGAGQSEKVQKMLRIVPEQRRRGITHPPAGQPPPQAEFAILGTSTTRRGEKLGFVPFSDAS